MLSRQPRPPSSSPPLDPATRTPITISPSSPLAPNRSTSTHHRPHLSLPQFLPTAGLLPPRRAESPLLRPSPHLYSAEPPLFPQLAAAPTRHHLDHQSRARTSVVRQLPDPPPSPTSTSLLRPIITSSPRQVRSCHGHRPSIPQSPIAATTCRCTTRSFPTVAIRDRVDLPPTSTLISSTSPCLPRQ